MDSASIGRNRLQLSANNVWRRVTNNENLPAPRYGHCVVASQLDVEPGLIFLGGSTTDGAFLESIVVWDLQTHCFRPPSEMPAVFGKGRNFSTVCSFESRLYLFGGKANGYFSSVLEMRDSRWSQLELSDTAEIPEARFGHASARVGHRWFTFGGYENVFSSTLNDLYCLDLRRLSWSLVACGNSPPERMHHTLSAHEGRLYACGGKTSAGKAVNMDVWVYDTAHRGNSSWRRVPVGSRGPAARWGHSATCVSSVKPCIIVFGGRDESKAFSDCWNFDLRSEKWSLFPLTAQFGAPEPRFFHSASLVSGTVFLFGGRDMHNVAFNSMFKFELHYCFWDLISADATLLILRWLDPQSLASMCCVSRDFNRVASCDALWKPIHENYHLFARGMTGVIWSDDTLEFRALAEAIRGGFSYKGRVIDRVRSDILNRNANSTGSAIRARHLATSTNNHKMVICGDGASGKTCFLIRAAQDMYPTEYVPTVFDNYSHMMFRDGKVHSVGMWDTNGGEDYDRLRPLSYPCTSVFLLAFSVVSPSSFANVKTKWWPEIQHHCPETPYILVGLKADIREDPEVNRRLAEKGYTPIGEPEAIRLAKDIGAKAYLETSALTGFGVRETMSIVLDVSIGEPRPLQEGREKCILQ